MNGTTLRGGCILLLVGLRAASAFEVGEAKWDARAFPIDYWIDPRMATTTEGVISPSVVQQAFARWSDLPSSSFIAVSRGLLETPGPSGDECRIGLEYIPPDVFPPPLARTRTDIAGDKIIRAEINFNTFYSLSSDDWLITAVHEVGHLAGLEHSSNLNAIMYATRDSIRRRDLHWDDIEGITFLYPASDLADLAPLGMLYPLYSSPQSAGPMAAQIRNIGFPAAVTVEATIYVSDSTEFDGSYLGKVTVFVTTTDPVTVQFSRVAFGAPTGPRYFGLEVDSRHECLESDETNNLVVIEIPILPFEPNGDQDLNGRVDWRDLFQFSSHWREFNNNLIERFRFDFGEKYAIGETDLLEFLNRWRAHTLPVP